MQTFLPDPSFAKSARILDNRRLGKQRVECKQILRALGVEIGGPAPRSEAWVHHPAVLMWRGYSHSLCKYAICMCNEWVRRGFEDSLCGQFVDTLRELRGGWRLFRPNPTWLGMPELHASHRSNLLRKDPAHYGQFGWSEQPDLPYHWPVRLEVHA